MLTPLHFGLPPKFTDWRSGQLNAIQEIIDSTKRVVAICAPTGFGKSLVYMAAAHMGGKRAAVLTSTKGLQDQLVTDFGGISADIRGKANYTCPAAVSLGYHVCTPVAEAPCQGGYNCPLKDGGGCEYYEKYRVAQRAPIVTTNYACWFYDALRKDKLTSDQPFDMLVLDEAHDAPEQLAGYLGVEIERKDVKALGIEWPDPEKMGFEGWKAWGQKWGKWAAAQRESCRDHRKGVAWRKIERKLGLVGRMSNEESWIIDPKFGVREPKVPLSVRFDPLWVQPYAESALFRGIDRIVLISATLTTKTLQLLGVSASDSKFVEYRSDFPVASRPVIHVPTVQMNFRNENDDYKLMKWVEKIDQILDGLLVKNGIIHTVSYKRARLIYENSRHSSRMLVHGSDNAKQIIEKYKRSSESLVLVSPSVTTGYDFPYKECEFQIIGKIPFPPMQDKVIKARAKQDKEYTSYITMQELVQEVGRGMRAKNDRCETLVIDDNVVWFLPQNRKFAPKWFMEAVKWEKEYQIPEPLEAL